MVGRAREDAQLLDWQVRYSAAGRSLGWRELWDPSSWSHYPNMFCFSNKWMAQESKYQKCIALHNGIPSEQGHVTMGHSRLPVLSLSICQWTWPPQLQQWGIQQHKHLAPRHRATTCAPAAFIFVVIFKDDILACRPLLLSSPWLFSTVV